MRHHLAGSVRSFGVIVAHLYPSNLTIYFHFCLGCLCFFTLDRNKDENRLKFLILPWIFFPFFSIF